MINKVLQAARGLRILRDWLGAGGQPVPIEQANARAAVCMNCPKHYPGSWSWNAITAMAIGSQLKLRETMGIKLDCDKDLHICEACGCVLKLKVHVPFEHLYRQTSDAEFSKFPDNCWQKHELNQMKNQ